MRDSTAYFDGTLAGLNDIRLGRWDCDNVVPPARHINNTQEWLQGYADSKENDNG